MKKDHSILRAWCGQHDTWFGLSVTLCGQHDSWCCLHDSFYGKHDMMSNFSCCSKATSMGQHDPMKQCITDMIKLHISDQTKPKIVGKGKKSA